MEMVAGCNTTGVLTATKLCYVGKARIASIKAMSDGSTDFDTSGGVAAGNIAVYDSSTATTSGKKLITKMYVEDDGKPHMYDFEFHGAIMAEGIYVVVTGDIQYSVEFF
tara:strand:+ start:1883 stop:2209 length:327 start_codon:yes stop_codon:yes gene_type:complete